MVKRVYKVIRAGNRTTLISVGKIIPKNWKYFIIENYEVKKNKITLTLKKVKINGEEA